MPLISPVKGRNSLLLGESAPMTRRLAASACDLQTWSFPSRFKSFAIFCSTCWWFGGAGFILGGQGSKQFGEWQGALTPVCVWVSLLPPGLSLGCLDLAEKLGEHQHLSWECWHQEQCLVDITPRSRNPCVWQHTPTTSCLGGDVSPPFSCLQEVVVLEQPSVALCPCSWLVLFNCSTTSLASGYKYL